MKPQFDLLNDFRFEKLVNSIDLDTLNEFGNL